MNLLFDFTCFQEISNAGIGGAPSFTKRVLDEVLQSRNTTVRIFALYDSRYSTGRAYNINSLAAQTDIALLDLSKRNIAQFVEEYNIDTFFCPLGQFIATYKVSNIRCKTVMFIHDIFDMERNDNWVDATITGEYSDGRWPWFKRIINLLSHRWNKQANALYQQIMPLYMSNRTIAYTVSEYSRNALLYYFPELIGHDIRICYSPAKQVNNQAQDIKNETLRRLVDSKVKYFLLLAGNRRYKNPHSVLKVFSRIVKEYPDVHLLTLRYGKQIHPNHIDVDFLSDEDLEFAYKHAYALIFASYFEGFGYPPLEAMKYGTPVVVSNVTSIPEIIGQAGIYFSPFYPADMYKAMKIVLHNRNCKEKEMKETLTRVNSRQQTDLKQLVNVLLSEN